MVPTLHQPCGCTVFVPKSLKIRVLIINIDERKLLAHKNGNENPIWSWNNSPGKLLTMVGYRSVLPKNAEASRFKM